MTVKISVVVPTYHRPQLLDRCLQALFAQTLDPAAFEIIVVDDDPLEGETRAIVENWQSQLALVRSVPMQTTLATATHSDSHYIDQFDFAVLFEPPVTPAVYYLPAFHTQGPAAARNLGWRAAAGEIIAFTDDDCLPAPDWLSKGLAAFSGDVAGVSGRVVVPLPEHPTDDERNIIGLEQSLFVTANCLYRKRALQMVGGFDENFPAAWREDSDLFFTLFEQGFHLVQAPEVVVVHPVRPAPWGASLRQQKKSIYNALLYKKHPQLYRQYIQSQPPWHYYSMIAALGVGLFGWAGSSSLLAIIGFCLWLAQGLAFTLRRLRETSRAPGHVAEMIITSFFIPCLSIYWRIKGALRYEVWFL